MASAKGGRRAFAFLGGCVLLPYNCLLLGQPYFDNRPFKGMQFPFTSMISYSLCLCLAQGYLTFRGESFSLYGRMAAAFIGTIIVCLALLLITVGAHFVGGITMYLAALLSVAALGVLNALMQTSILGLSGIMGQEMSAACMLGFGISGIVSLALSFLVQGVASKADVSKEMNGFYVTVIAFAFCFFYTLASASVYRFLRLKVPAAAEAIRGLEIQRLSHRNDCERPHTANSGGRALIHEREAPMEIRAEAKEASIELSPSGESKLQRTLSVLTEVAPQAVNVWLVFAVTMTVFPGVLTKWKGSSFFPSQEFFGTLLIGCFQVFDVVGRSMSGICAKVITPARLWIFVILRLAFIPLFILGQRHPQWCALWGSDTGRLFLSAALAATNGLLATLAMMYGPARCPPERCEVAGIAMSCTMVTGIFSGTLLAFLTQLGA